MDDQNDYNIYTHRAIAMLPDRFQDTDERLFELEKSLQSVKNYRRTEKSA